MMQSVIATVNIIHKCIKTSIGHIFKKKKKKKKKEGEGEKEKNSKQADKQANEQKPQ